MPKPIPTRADRECNRADLRERLAAVGGVQAGPGEQVRVPPTAFALFVERVFLVERQRSSHRARCDAYGTDRKSDVPQRLRRALRAVGLGRWR